ncbi:MAG TPA: hypothetical protein VFP98_06000, partial [Candidatus Polarisedimenticolia bacterium]|nr:hypothetical protein [Candidatus Polarisedimenticolia bacterium]
HAAPRQGVSIFSTRTPGSGVCLALTARDRNPYGIGGWRVPAAERSALLSPERNLVEIEL